MNQALLVIDAQQALIDGDDQEIGVYNKDALLKNINSVVDLAVRSYIQIVYIRDTSVAGGHGPGFQVHREIHIPEGAEMFNKNGVNAFYQTPLLSFLQDRQIAHLVVMGCQTEYCVDTAVRTATINGFDVTLVGDGHSTCDSPVLSAKQIIAHHNSILNGYANIDHFSLVRQTNEDLFQPVHDRYRQ